MTRKLPNADQAVVDRRKIVDHLLSRRHPDGRNKAAFFFAFGFRTARWGGSPKRCGPMDEMAQ
ncbi:MAG: hypothetical protein OXH04_11955 [Acidobacteria bacterium]|nr:hypothetical protein [Acidobacteriota bacterium]